MLFNGLVGGMDFRSRVKDSFVKIKDDIDKLESGLASQTSIVENLQAGIDKSFKQLDLKLDHIYSHVNYLSNVLGELMKKIDAGQGGTSSTGNRDSSGCMSSVESLSEDPIVSNGTSPNNECLGRENLGTRSLSSFNEVDISGNSSKGNVTSTPILSSYDLRRNHPLVTNGTIPKKESKRALGVKEKILVFSKGGVYLKDVFHWAVDENEFCSKTTFYRLIKELVDNSSVEILLVDNKRLLKPKD